MKLKISLILILLFAFSASGQSALQTPAHGLNVVQKKWSVMQKTNTVKTAEDADKAAAVGKQQQDIAENIRNNQNRASQNLPLTRMPIKRDTNYKYKDVKVTVYTYEAIFRNDNAKNIKEITWDYVFSDPVTKKEITRRSFTSKENIRSGKEKISAKSSLPPSNIVNALSTSTNQYIEEIQICRRLNVGILIFSVNASEQLSFLLKHI